MPKITKSISNDKKRNSRVEQDGASSPKTRGSRSSATAIDNTKKMAELSLSPAGSPENNNDQQQQHKSRKRPFGSSASVALISTGIRKKKLSIGSEKATAFSTSTPIRRNRKSVVFTPSSNYSPRKTRAVRRLEEDGEAGVAEGQSKCLQCHRFRPVEKLRQCPLCSHSFHLECAQLQPETLAYLYAHPTKWRCPRCVVCQKCEEPIADAQNVQCMHCARAWHGECRPKRTRPPQYPYHRWTCEACKNFLPHEQTPPMPPQSTSSSSQPESASRLQRETQSASVQQRHEERQQAQIERCKSLRSAKVVSAKTAEEGAMATPLRRKSVKIEEPTLDLEAVQEHTKQMRLHRWMAGQDKPEQQAKQKKKKRHRSTDIQLLLDSPLSVRRFHCSAGRTRKDQLAPVARDPNEEGEGCTDVESQQMRVLAEMGYQPGDLSNRNMSNEWVQFGQFVRFRPAYESAYQEPIQSAPTVYICEFCLTPVAELIKFKSHVMFCRRRFPPGNEIYRNKEEGWNVWEVEGNIETSYCRNLCLFAKFFLTSKTLYHEVDTFTFYLLTEITPRGCVLVGYFSKEKNPSKNNNLSCLLTLPSAQGHGYGKLLIDLSYQMSKLEHKIGSPEHPLSDLGLLTYRSYWRSVLFSMLRQRRGSQVVSIKELSIETAIHSYDIISTLLANDMLLFRNDGYYIDPNKALNASLASLRRRTIQPDLLLWMPPFDVNPHSSKMNSYAAD